MNYRKQHLAGITIIEVLFSVGIVVTGLLGVAGLIMIAGAQMTQGLEADAMSNAGLNAVAEFDTRKMRRPDSLLWYNPSTNSFTSVLSSNLYGPGADNRWGVRDNNDDGIGPVDDIYEAGFGDDIYDPSPSFCIDPFFIAQQVVDGNTNIYEVGRFPGIRADLDDIDDDDDGAIDELDEANWIAPWQMRRVTLRNTSRLGNVDYPFGTRNVSNLLPCIMNLLQSREIFSIKDDLVFNIPTAATELPQQSWITDQGVLTNNIDDDDDGTKDELDEARQANGSDDDHDGVKDELDEANVKRLNAAKTSWMATLTPNRNRIQSVTVPQLKPTDQYLLSIVIFNNRFMNYTGANAAPEKERLLNITFLNKGFGGGEVSLSAPLVLGSGLPGHTALELKHGDWVMLSADSEIGSCFRWYRISYIEDETQLMRDDNNNVIGYYRLATLKGPDWSRPEWHNGTFTTQVTFIPGVVGVFERTIRIESTSLY